MTAAFRSVYAGEHGRPLRAAEGGLVYHVLNRANGRLPLFEKDSVYLAFERVLIEAQKRFAMRILAYCVMPNHWNLVLWPEQDRDLPASTGWLTLTHTQRWHAHYHNTGSGHVYQGRFKSFPVQSDEHLLTVCRYVERNALRAGLVAQAEAWPWCSPWRRECSQPDAKEWLAVWPVPRRADWVQWVNKPQTAGEFEVFLYYWQGLTSRLSAWPPSKKRSI